MTNFMRFLSIPSSRTYLSQPRGVGPPGIHRPHSATDSGATEPLISSQRRATAPRDSKALSRQRSCRHGSVTMLPHLSEIDLTSPTRLCRTQKLGSVFRRNQAHSQIEPRAMISCNDPALSTFVSREVGGQSDLASTVSNRTDFAAGALASNDCRCQQPVAPGPLASGTLISKWVCGDDGPTACWAATVARSSATTVSMGRSVSTFRTGRLA